jgi:hypothetical protein
MKLPGRVSNPISAIMTRFAAVVNRARRQVTMLPFSGH